MKTQETTKVINFIMVGVALLLLPYSIFAKPISITIFDTGFCTSKLKDTPKNIHLHKTYNSTGNKEISCSAIDPSNRRYHGHSVLRELLSHLKTIEKKIEIYPVIIFDKQGSQSKSYWKSAIEWAMSKNIDVLLTAIGLPIDNIPTYSLLPINFIASGQRGVGISKTTKLFPQHIAKGPSSFIIGNYLPATKYDTSIANPDLLYTSNIKYYFASKGGSSLAVASALGRALKLCLSSFSAAVKLNQCLESHKKLLTKDHYTF